MKRIPNRPSYVKLGRRRLKRSARHVRSRSRRKRGDFNIAAVRRTVLAQGLGYENLQAPRIFSFVNAPEDMISFVQRLKQILFQFNRSVIIDLSLVTEVTNDAIILLMSVVQDRGVPKRLRVVVKNPIDQKAAKRLKESGIDEHYEVQQVPSPSAGHIRVKHSYDADTEMANELIQFATRELFGRRQRLTKVQRILSECISNTEEHASGHKGVAKEKKWWGTVFCDRKKGIAYFSLVDNGVGICESLRSEWFSRLPSLALHPTNVSLMRAVFSGKVLSSTNLTNRGNGLPAIYNARNKGQFERLILVTNNVYIDFDRDEYRLLPNSFSGTFFYWEVHK